MGSLVFGYFLLCLIFFVIAVAVLRWAFRINKIVSELGQIRETLIFAYGSSPKEKKQYPGHLEGCRCKKCQEVKESNS